MSEIRPFWIFDSRFWIGKIIQNPKSKIQNRLAVTGWLIAATIVAARLFPFVLQPGMFFDGVTHAAIARNLSRGVGDVWHPVNSPAAGPDYFDQPTLAFWLESQFYRACGDHFWVEKLYSALTGLATAAALAMIWRQLVGSDSALRSCAWIPVALWAILPSWSWMYENNMLENTLGLFATLAVYALLRAVGPHPDQLPASPRVGLSGFLGAVIWLALGGVCIAAAALSKGPVGLFPLVTPLVAWATLRRTSLSRGVAMNVALLFFVAAPLAVVLARPDAREYLTTYWHVQIGKSLAGERETVASRLGRLYILTKLAGELVLPAAVAAGLVWFARRRRSSALAATTRDPQERRAVAFCLLTAASASLPIIVSPKQSGHYAFPSYAFYALALALWCGPAVIQLLTSAAPSSSPERVHRWLRGVAAAAIAVVVVLSVVRAGRPHRDSDVLHDTFVLRDLVPRSTTIDAAPELAVDYPLHTDLARWDDLTIDARPDKKTIPSEFFLTLRDAAPPTGAAYVAMPTEMVRYQLFRRSDAPISAGSPDENGPPRLGQTPKDRPR